MDLPENEIFAIVRTLSLIWEKMKSDSFWTELALIHGRKHPLDPSKIECLIIAHALEGNFSTGSMGGLIGGWWKVSDKGMKHIEYPNLIDSNDSHGLDPTPLIRFYTDGAQILIGERFGLSLIARKLGVLTETNSWIDKLKLIQIL